MPFSGILVTAGYVGSLSNRNRTLALPGKAVWSEPAVGTNQALPYTTTGVAPAASDTAGDPVFTVVTDVDAHVVIAQNPTSAGAHYLLKAGVERTLYAQPGDKLYAVAA